MTPPEPQRTDVRCRHCGERIVLVNFALGPAWTHQPAGAAFQDHAHRECHRTLAEPWPECEADGCEERTPLTRCSFHTVSDIDADIEASA